MKAPLVKSVSETFVGGESRAVIVLETAMVEAAHILDGCDTSELADAQLEAILGHPALKPDAPAVPAPAPANPSVNPLPLPEHPAADGKAS